MRTRCLCDDTCTQDTVVQGSATNRRQRRRAFHTIRHKEKHRDKRITQQGYPGKGTHHKDVRDEHVLKGGADVTNQQDDPTEAARKAGQEGADPQGDHDQGS